MAIERTRRDLPAGDVPVVPVPVRRYPTTAASLGLLFLRLPIGAYFLLAGVGKFRGGVAAFVQSQAETAAKYMPANVSNVFLNVLPYAEVTLGALLILGLLTRVAGLICTLLLISFTVAATGWRHEQLPFQPNLVYIGVALAILFCGPGRISVDELLFGPRRKVVVTEEYTERAGDAGPRAGRPARREPGGLVAHSNVGMLRRLLLILGAWVACGGCSAVIVPPPPPVRDPVPVLVADYGYHSTLILPRAEGGLIEYAYGDWTYFGQNRKSVSTALHALLASEQATLGRRVLDRRADDPGIEQATGAKTVIRLEAPRKKVLELERALEERYSARLDSMTYSPVHQLYFVKDDERYGVVNNCNHFTARWLERLGCQVKGIVIGSGFRVKDVAGPATRPTTTQPS